MGQAALHVAVDAGALQRAGRVVVLGNGTAQGNSRAAVDLRLIRVNGYYIPFEEWNEEVKQYYRYDPEAAEKLLDEAGYPRGAVYR